jgi:copper chaperone
MSNTNTVTTLKVEGMSCNHCVNSIKNAVGALKGVTGVEVDLAKKQVTVSYTAGSVTLESITETIEDQGYEVV